MSIAHASPRDGSPPAGAAARWVERGMYRAFRHGVPRPRVLVADDDLEMLEAVGSAVEELGADVVRVTTSGALIEHLAADPPYQLMITDLAMPWLNGLQVAHGVRSSGLRLPIILITARATPEIQRQVSELGDDAVLLRKPFAFAELEAAVRSKLPGPPR